MNKDNFKFLKDRKNTFTRAGVIGYEHMFGELVRQGKWDMIFKYFKPVHNFGGTKQTKESYMKYLNEYNAVDSLRFLIKQDDELVLAALENNIENLKYVRIPLKIATMVEIDLLFSSKIEKSIELKFWYTILMEKAI